MIGTTPGSTPSRTVARRVCLVTNELYPLAPGGIGRLMSNWMIQNAALDEPVDLHLLLAGELLDKKEAILAYAGRFGVTCHFCQPEDLRQTRQGGLCEQLPDETWDYHHAHSVSYRYFLALYRLWREGVRFDLVEFPDYGGWGAISIEAKRARLCFDGCAFAVRLHSSYGLIVDAEPLHHMPSGWGAAVMDLEHFALRHADRVVGHVASVAALNRRFYKFDQAWLDRVVIEAPPIYRDAHRADEPLVGGSERRFVFSSRFQPFKRPDLFIKAACLFLEEDPRECEFLLISYGWDAEYIAWLGRLIPPRHADRIKIMTGLSFAERRALLDGAIVVIPSDFESYCLFAYESAAEGQRLLLRRSCLAFGEHPAWKDGENCLLFGDDPAELAQRMADALIWQPSSRAEPVPDRPHWHLPPPAARPARAPDTVATHVVIHGVRSAGDLRRAIEVVRLLKLRSGSILTQVDADEATLASLPAGIALVRSRYGEVEPDEAWALAAKAHEPAVCFVSVEDAPDPWFFASAASVLASRPEIGVVTCNDAVVDLRSREPKGIAYPAGEHRSSALSGLPVVGRLVCVRRELIARHPYPLAARAGGWQQIFFRLQQAGAGICVLPEALNTTALDGGASASPRVIAGRLAAALESSAGFASSYGLRLSDVSAVTSGETRVRVQADATAPIQRVWPQRAEAWGDPVSFNAEYGGWLVHPVDDAVVIARLHLDPALRRGKSFFVEVGNESDANQGFLFSVVAGDAAWGEPEIGRLSAPGGMAAARLIGPRERAVVTCWPAGAETTDLYLMAHPRPGGTAEHCLAFVFGYGAAVG